MTNKPLPLGGGYRGSIYRPISQPLAWQRVTLRWSSDYRTPYFPRVF